MKLFLEFIAYAFLDNNILNEKIALTLKWKRALCIMVSSILLCIYAAEVLFSLTPVTRTAICNAEIKKKKS